MTALAIIKLAREAGMVWASGLNGAGYHINHPDDLERFAKLVAEHSASVEREACAKVCIELPAQLEEFGALNRAVAAIRARGNT